MAVHAAAAETPWLYWCVAIAGLVLVSMLTRSFFFLRQSSMEMPAWVEKGLRYAPLAALAAVVAPEVVLTQGAWTGEWQDARVWSALLAAGYAAWRHDMMGTILLGMGVFLLLKLGLGW
jgi:branched-subunit amino acid transport protein